MTVFANGLEVACKAQSNKVIAAFPDVCFTPPQTPATPPGVPIPYPSFGMDSDTNKGTSTVKIGGKTVTQKNKSYLSKTTGTEAGSAPKKGVITSKNTGKEYAHAWSGNVKAQGEPVSRFSDISSNNHASPTGNTPPFPKVGKVDAPGVFSDDECLVGPYDAIRKACNKAGGEAHHVVPDKVFRTGSRKEAMAIPKGSADPKRIKNAPTLGEGVCICIKSDAHKGLHSAEKEGIKKLGKPGLKDLKGKALKDAKTKLKVKGEYGTANVIKIHEKSNESLDNLVKPNSPKSVKDCVEKAKEKVDEQAAEFDADQIGRTSGPLPNKEARDRMIP